MDFRNLLGKLNQLNESVEVVAEKAESENQATAARIALKHKEEGTKPKAGTASAEMMKMSKSDLKDFTKAKKGAPKKKTNESIEEANESPEQRLEAIKAAYEAGVRNLKTIEQMLMMTPPGGNRDQYEADLDWQQKRLATLKKDYQALEAGMKGADDIRANAQANAEGVEEGVVSDMRLSPKMQEWLKNATDEEINRMVFASGDDSLRAGAEVERLKKARAELQGQTGESFDRDAFREAFEAMVEAKSKMPDFPDVDGDGNKKEPIEQAQKDAKEKGGEEKSDKKGLSAKQKKLPPGLQKAISKKNEDINESFEKLINNEKLTFEEAVKIVRESGGQQKIDPVDTTLWNWAQRVAANKFEESRKAELYAGLIYERNGGVFELHDVLSED